MFVATRLKHSSSSEEEDSEEEPDNYDAMDAEDEQSHAVDFLEGLEVTGDNRIVVAKQAGETLPEHDELDGEWRALQVASQNVALRARQQLTRQAGTPWGSLRIQTGKHDNTDCLVGVWTTHHRMDPLELLKQHTQLKKSAQLASTVEIIFQSVDCFKFTLCVSSYNTWRKENESVVWLSQ